MRRFRRKQIDKTVELNITAFLNLMVILVPFLLITAVFSRMTILELNLPALDAKNKNNDKDKLQLEVVIRENSFDIREARLGVIKKLIHKEGDIDWKAFSETMIEIKKRFPEEKNIRLLLENNVAYKNLIKVMDHVRTAQVVEVTSLENIELFPVISIGDAPKRR